MKSPGNAALLVTAAFCLFAAPMAFAQDSVTVNTVTASSTTVDVPVSIRDVSGTTLGIDQPSGSRIQSFSLKVDYAPAAAVQSITFSRAGITAGLTPVSEFTPSGSGTVSLLDTFQESTSLIPFTSNAPPPGNQVAHLVITLSSSAAPGTSISLTLDPSLTQLTDQGGTASTKETTSNGRLALVNGAINIPALNVALAPSSKNVPHGGTALLNVSLSGTPTSSTTVTLSSSNTAVATVPASVTFQAGSTFTQIAVTGVTLGTATITATLGSSTSTSSVTVVDVPCTTPDAPQPTAPATADIGATYTVSWPPISGATEYSIDESTDPGFASPVSQTVTGTSASFSHGTGGVRYYYRVKARNHGGNCDISSAFSTAISVLINAAPAPPSQVFPVVGSLPGSFGSFFKTSAQLYNASSTTISGKLIFHTANATGSASDPSFVYSIAPGKTLSFADLLPAMGIATGLGSVDIVPDSGSAFPIALARVFNDGGANGTTGLAEDSLSTDSATRAGTSAVLLAPADAQKFRLNIGVRSLDQGAAMNVTVRDKDGVVVKTTSKTYGPTFFSQVGAAVMLDGYTLAGGETITFDVTSGSAFIYGSTTDNTTNDPSVQFARKVQ